MKLPVGITREQIVAHHRAHIWPPYTSSEQHTQRDPLVFVDGEGSWLVDANGKRYLDGISSWWTVMLGHKHPRLIRAIRQQAEQLAHVAMAHSTNVAAALLAKELIDVAPTGMARVHFSDDGSTAVEVAIKIATQFWRQNGAPKKQRILKLSRSFHGDTVGAMSVSGHQSFRSAYAPLLFDTIEVVPHSRVRSWDEVFADMINCIATQHDELAAVIIEPLIQGAAGMQMYSPALLAALAESARKHDVLLVADEVFTGYGRTGAMWACDLAEVTPDLMCIGKAFTGGVLPMAATLATQRVWEGFSGGMDRALMHGHTFSGNPLGAAVAREVLAIYRDDNILDQIQEKHLIVLEGMQRIGRTCDVANTRNRGMVCAIDLGDDGYAGKLGWQVYDRALELGIWVRPLGDTVYITPPYTISEPDLRLLLDGLQQAIFATVPPP